ncbi:MAG: AMP-binding protein [Gammaproteobacteria bacterium]|nr:AMP-binding protein [Gammaproteobacteria bacterium]MBT7308358.1 AMP-binding protein [Gammaproteobacteria bacterium]
MSPPAIVVETSGSEGEAKKVALSYAMLRASARMGQQLEELRAGDCWLNCLPQFHVGGLAIHYRCEEAGASMLLHRDFDPARIERELDNGSVTHLSLVPVMLAKLLEQYGGRPAPQPLRTVLIGGDRLPKPLAERAVATSWPIVVSYGMTETASRITMLRLCRENIERWEESDVGPPLPGVTLSIGEQGAVHIQSDRLFPGAVQALISADRGAIDEAGHLHLYGRLDQQILSGGELIDPLEVEQRMLQCPWITGVAITELPDPQWGARIVAVVKSEYPIEDLRLWTKKQLPGYLRPRAFVRVAQFPRGKTGKLDRRGLKALVASTIECGEGSW